MENKVKTYHANLLKKYVDRRVVSCITDCDVGVACLQYVGAAVVDVSGSGDSSMTNGNGVPDISLPPLLSQETSKRLMYPQLSTEQSKQVSDLLVEYHNVPSDLPGRTDCIEYKIRLTCMDTARSKPYPPPHHTRKVVAAEVDAMLNMGVIVPSVVSCFTHCTREEKGW